MNQTPSAPKLASKPPAATLARPRQGPRPLVLHLLIAKAIWESSRLALPLLKNGLPPLTAQAARAKASLLAELRDVPLAEFEAAVEQEIAGRSDRFLSGIEIYRSHPYRRRLADPAAIWQEGDTRLLDYGRGDPDAPSVLVVPSMINRSYILDLMEERSLLRYLAAEGFRPLLVDWGSPDEVSRDYDLTGYIAGRLERAFEAASDATRGPMHLFGYCMGGMMALALAQRRARHIGRIVLVATPWDFAAVPTAITSPFSSVALLAEACAPLGVMPTDVLQTLFFLSDPALAVRKFSRLAARHEAGEDLSRFVAVEDWLNDGVPMALPVARECFGSWCRDGNPASDGWLITGHPVSPAAIDAPSLLIVSNTDRLVPTASARPLANQLKNAQVIETELGHVGMIVGSRAPAEIWPAVRNHLRAC